MMTERLYYTDAYLRAFTARVEAVEPEGQWGPHPGVSLDRTAFYPTSGGQPHDTGTLAAAPVVDVVEANGSIVHVIAGPEEGTPPLLSIAPGSVVEGTVDWPRRFDH